MSPPSSGKTPSMFFIAFCAESTVHLSIWSFIYRYYAPAEIRLYNKLNPLFKF